MVAAAYVLATFLSAFLLFSVQPMLARLLLPLYGGVPLVWTTMLAFFETLLLLGYLYVFAMERLLTLRQRACLHVGLLTLPLFALPMRLPADAAPPAELLPVAWLLWTLLRTVGLPFVLISTTSPLLQHWFTALRHRRAHDPYFLYVASNAGSLLALLAYPLAIEPHLALKRQADAWFWGYLALMASLAACASRVWTAAAASGATAPEEVARSPLTVWRRLAWLGLAFLPSALLGSVTTFITTDTASIPLWWVVPLVIYLGSFMLVFANPPLWRRAWGPPLLACGLALLAIPAGTLTTLVLLHVSAYTVAVLFCHGELARDRPPVDRLTEFYVWMAAGGALGGIFNAIAAPALFTSVAEYPLSRMAIAALALGTVSGGLARRDIGRLVGVALVAATTVWALQTHVEALHQKGFLLAIVAAFAAAIVAYPRYPLRIALAYSVILPGLNSMLTTENVLEARRSFFGVYRVAAWEDGKKHTLISGTTVHGAQFTDPNRALVPLMYYHPKGPAGHAFARLAPAHQHDPVAVVGLGAGALACYGRLGQAWDFYELDDAVKDLASDARHFTFLRDCPGERRIITGDARLTLHHAPPHRYGIMVLDAYGSDAVPIHLLTREAVALYLDKLTHDGVLLFHLSNRFYDLDRVIYSLAAAADLHVFDALDSNISDAERDEGKAASHWMAVARTPAALAPLNGDSLWRPAQPPAAVAAPWTDDFSAVVSVLHGFEKPAVADDAP